MVNQFKSERILIAGFGGQGILLAGKLLAAAAIDCADNVTLLPSYGAEVRGGTCNCQVILSTAEIASPNAEEVDSMMIMNQASADKYLKRLAPDGIAVINTSLCTQIDRPGITCLPATAAAAHLGDIRVANIVMLGAYAALRGTVPVSAMQGCLKSIFKTKGRALIELNLAALAKGMELASRTDARRH